MAKATVQSGGSNGNFTLKQKQKRRKKEKKKNGYRIWLDRRCAYCVRGHLNILESNSVAGPSVDFIFFFIRFFGHFVCVCGMARLCVTCV